MSTKNKTFCNELTGPNVVMKVNTKVTGYQESEVDLEIDTSTYFEGGNKNTENSQDKKGIKKKTYSSRKAQTYDDLNSGEDEEDENEEKQPKDIPNQEKDDETSTTKPNPRFKNYSDLFMNLTKHKSRPTMYPIVHVNITYDSTRAITVTKKDDKEFWVK